MLGAFLREEGQCALGSVSRGQLCVNVLACGHRESRVSFHCAVFVLVTPRKLFFSYPHAYVSRVWAGLAAR